MRRILGMIGLAGLIATAALAGGASAAGPQGPAGSQGPTRIVSPSLDQVVGNGRVRVVVRSRASLGALRISVDGRNVKRYFQRSGGSYRATLTLGSGLHFGVDELDVITGPNKFNTVEFVVARRVRNLLKVTRVRSGADGAPDGVLARTAPGSTLQVWVNGHRDDGAFQPQGNHYVGRLGANDWLRAGRNRLVVLAYRASSSGRSAVYQEQQQIFHRKPGQLTAAAGRDRVDTAGDLIRLGGRETGGGKAVTYRWTIVGHPEGAPATLLDADSATPGFVAETAGDYLIRETVTGASGSSSVDTATVAVRADTPPIGWRLDTTGDRGTITLNGAAVPKTTWQCPPNDPVCLGYTFESYAVYDRQTLALVESGSGIADPAGVKFLADRAAYYNKAPTYLMIVNFSGLFGLSADAKRLFQTLGVNDLGAPANPNTARPVSIVGVPGSPAGSAIISDHFKDCNCAVPPLSGADMSGYVRLNPASSTGGYFEFVFADQAEFNTDDGTNPSQIRIRVGNATAQVGVPTDGSSGFALVRADSQTLAIDRSFTYVTNKPDGSENPSDAQALANNLADVAAGANAHGRQLLLLQSFGAPKGTSPGWLAAAAAIQKLGGNAQVFVRLNQGSDLEPHQGRYAFVGRPAMDVVGAESSQSLTGEDTDGTLHGLLARGRDDQYEPVAADPTGTINFALVRIVNRPMLPDGGFPVFTPGQAAAATWLSANIIRVCSEGTPSCVRKAYYENLTALWDTILTRLGSSATATSCDSAGASAGFTHADCDSAIREFEQEIDWRNTVAAYFEQLRRPFDQAQLGTPLDLNDIAQQIRQAAQPPTDENSTAHALSILAFILKIGSLSGVICQQCSSVASGLGAVFGLAAYLTNQNGSPDLIGPRVTALATQLGTELFRRYQAVSDYMTTEAKIIMSDWSKLRDVAALAFNANGWQPADTSTTREQIRLATQQTIWQTLLPAAYPVLYDLGTGVTQATDWRCIGQGLTVQKNLFQHTDKGAELTYKMTGPSDTGQNHLFVAGETHAKLNTTHAYIPSPPASLTDRLFLDPTQGGLGLYKLSLYSPQYFRVFDRVLQQTVHQTEHGFFYCQDMPNPPGNSG